MRITCPNCGGPHPKWECKKPAAKTSGQKMVDDFVVFGTTASVDGEYVRVAPPHPPIVAMDFSTPTGATMHIELMKPDATQIEMLRSMEEARRVIADAFNLTPAKRGRPSNGYDKKLRDRERIAAKRAAAKAGAK